MVAPYVWRNSTVTVTGCPPRLAGRRYNGLGGQPPPRALTGRHCCWPRVWGSCRRAA